MSDDSKNKKVIDLRRFFQNDKEQGNRDYKDEAYKYIKSRAKRPDCYDEDI